MRAARGKEDLLRDYNEFLSSADKRLPNADLTKDVRTSEVFGSKV